MLKTNMVNVTIVKNILRQSEIDITQVSKLSFGVNRK